MNSNRSTPYLITGNDLKGKAAPPTMEEAEAIRAEKKKLGLRCSVRRKHETFLGERFPTNVIRVSWEP